MRALSAISGSNLEIFFPNRHSVTYSGMPSMHSTRQIFAMESHYACRPFRNCWRAPQLTNTFF